MRRRHRRVRMPDVPPIEGEQMLDLGISPHRSPRRSRITAGNSASWQLSASSRRRSTRSPRPPRRGPRSRCGSRRRARTGPWAAASTRLTYDGQLQGRDRHQRRHPAEDRRPPEVAQGAEPGRVDRGVVAAEADPAAGHRLALARTCRAASRTGAAARAGGRAAAARLELLGDLGARRPAAARPAATPQIEVLLARGGEDDRRLADQLPVLEQPRPRRRRPACPGASPPPRLRPGRPAPPRGSGRRSSAAAVPARRARPGRRGCRARRGRRRWGRSARSRRNRRRPRSARLRAAAPRAPARRS